MNDNDNPFGDEDAEIFDEEEEILVILEDAGVSEKECDEIIALVHEALKKVWEKE